MLFSIKPHVHAIMKFRLFGFSSPARMLAEVKSSMIWRLLSFAVSETSSVLWEVDCRFNAHSVIRYVNNRELGESGLLKFARGGWNFTVCS